ncbi:hypothetical protein HPB47_020281 [Ixodes persulcatus]|uniref:Uncharacterized protein n=1 Tax=Ixodes persulcatus TaxID=34615 RepID=A0AC60QFX4_IXOPE|nr:hypothetical protein HPB47_020281 [Ixodes persulcatus]
MAADASFADFVDFLLRTDEVLHDGRDPDQAVDVPRRRCRDRLNPLEHFNDWEFLVRYHFTKSTVVSLLQPSQDPSCSFFTLLLRWPGFAHDSWIFETSRARVLYENQRIPGLLLGDAGYACMSFLLTPLTNPGVANSLKVRYQAVHLKTRNSVERAFEVFKRRFPCLDMWLQYKAERSALIITACAALHNLARLRKEPCPPVLPSPPVPRRRRRLRPHALPSPPDPVDTINGSLKRTQIIALCFQ